MSDDLARRVEALESHVQRIMGRLRDYDALLKRQMGVANDGVDRDPDIRGYRGHQNAQLDRKVVR